MSVTAENLGRLTASRKLFLCLGGLIATASMVFASLGVPAFRPHLTVFTSPDRRVVARVLTSSGRNKNESRVEVRLRSGKLLIAHDFSSADGEHGSGVDAAVWTGDARFFVLQMSNSGGHMPTYQPVVFWSRRENCFYRLQKYTVDRTFTTFGRDNVRLSTWPESKAATIALHELSNDQLSRLP